MHSHSHLYTYLLFPFRYFENGYESKTLWITYLIASIAIPVAVALTSAGKEVPDIPDTFIKRYNTDTVLCSFESKCTPIHVNLFTQFSTTFIWNVVASASIWFLDHSEILKPPANCSNCYSPDVISWINILSTLEIHPYL